MCGGWGEVGEPRGGRKERAVFPLSCSMAFSSYQLCPCCLLIAVGGRGQRGMPRWDGMEEMGRHGIGWNGMGLDGTGRDGMEWNGMGRDAMGWDEILSAPVPFPCPIPSPLCTTRGSRRRFGDCSGALAAGRRVSYGRPEGSEPRSWKWPTTCCNWEGSGGRKGKRWVETDIPVIYFREKSFKMSSVISHKKSGYTG